MSVPFFELKGREGVYPVQNLMLIKILYRVNSRISSRFRVIWKKLNFWGKKVKNRKIDINHR